MNARQLFIVLICLAALTACGLSYNTNPKNIKDYLHRSSQQTDTLLAVAGECDHDLTMFILKGKATIPTDIQQIFISKTPRDIKVCGNFSLELIDARNANYAPNAVFKIFGKAIGADVSTCDSILPIFYIERWEQTPFSLNETNMKSR